MACPFTFGIVPFVTDVDKEPSFLEEVLVEFDDPKTTGVLEADEVDVPPNTVALGFPNVLEADSVDERDGLNADGVPKAVAVLLDERRDFEAAPKVGADLAEVGANGSRP